jgi:hypothetical protein
MHSPIATRDYDYSFPSADDQTHLSRAFIRTYIIVHKLIVLAAIILLPLLAWHNAMTDLFDKYDMPVTWEQTFQRIQLSRPRTWLWVALWILVGCSAGQ